MRMYRRSGSDAWWADHWAGGKRHRGSMGTADRREAEKKAREWARSLDEHYSVRRVEVRLSTAVESFIRHCRESGLSKQTVRGYSGRLAGFLSRVGDEDLSAWTPDDACDRVAGFLDARSGEVTSVKHDRLPLSAFFNYLRSRRWYVGDNPADAKLHLLRKPRGKLKTTRRCTTPEEDMVLRRESQKSVLWPVILLARWAGLRRGEACTLRWSEVNLEEGYVDVVGHEWGRKHPRRVWLAPWVVLQLRLLKPAQVPGGGAWPVWPYHPDTATDEMAAFCSTHLRRQVGFNDLRASFATECYRCGLTPAEESRMVGHGVEVAEKHYVEYEAQEARSKLPPDPITDPARAGPAPDADSDAGPRANVAQ